MTASSDDRNQHDEPDEPMATGTAEPARTGHRARQDRLVDDAGLDSFPASDPPGWWSGLEPATPTTDGTAWA
jgi:hypothetical protein